ncbi:MAG: Lrp/AsnC ligand binding domain-containing protein [Nitrospirae bacterium]|nr:Lrp/AsnC ligand binding domain-containing protein [Nitrospirota bacterium]MDA8214155.1 Lrp/AsnC ligand binding domain-containing protein [Nitrospiraceae bacterium]MDA8338326.1 Lrp/AsnC ligand binding domain-containing protein [Nitrospiraceae bacterium]
MARVYLLVNVLPGKDVSIRDTLRGIKGVANADVVTGHYDIVAVLEAKNTSEIFDKILKKIRLIKGINRTETFVAVE